jgi:predicted SnoaL-like aldol condensation-catalyzing enzyme
MERVIGFSRARKEQLQRVEMVHVWRLADGKIVEDWAVRDDLDLMLGVVSG